MWEAEDDKRKLTSNCEVDKLKRYFTFGLDMERQGNRPRIFLTKDEENLIVKEQIHILTALKSNVFFLLYLINNQYTSFLFFR